MIKIGDRIKLINEVKRYIKPPADPHGWFTVEKVHDTDSPGWYNLLEDANKVAFKDTEMIKAKKPTIIIL